VRDLNEGNITTAVISAMDNTRDPRLREILGSLIRCLHEFVREVQLSPEEWRFAMGFLRQLGDTTTPKRQEFVLASGFLGVSSLVDILSTGDDSGATEASVLGPFYLENAPLRAVGADLAADNPGETVLVRGSVTDPHGAPIPGALLEIWSNAANGLYSNVDPDQSDHNLRCRMPADGDGAYRFRTIKPTAYKVPDDGPVGDLIRATGRRAWRPAHIHFMISAPGHETLVTELFAADDPYIDGDAVFGVRASLAVDFTVNHSADDAAKYDLESPFDMVEYDFVLRPRKDSPPA
jgi:hydroxyquinol 1,2-dioxygenase